MLRIPGVSHAIVRSAATQLGELIDLVGGRGDFWTGHALALLMGERHDVVLRGHVEIAGRLVGEDNRRTIAQRPRDGDALPESPLVPVESEPPESELLPGAPHVGAATELLLLAGGLGLLRGEQLVRHGHRRHGPAGHAKRDTAHRHDQQLDCELRRHLDLLHADDGEYADLVFAFADVEQIEHDRTDRQYDDEQREGELGEVVERHEARFVVLHVGGLHGAGVVQSGLPDVGAKVS